VIIDKKGIYIEHPGRLAASQQASCSCAKWCNRCFIYISLHGR